MSFCILQLPLAAMTKESAKSFMDRFVDQLPAPNEVLDQLQRLPAWEAAILLLAGVVYMLWGWKIFKILVTMNLAAVGFFLGSAVATLIVTPHDSHAAAQGNWPLYGGLIGAAVLAILAWPLMKFAVSLMGAAAGAFAGYHLWHYLATLHKPEWVQYSWVGGLVGLLLLAALAFVIFRTVIMLFTSLQGAVLAVAGCVALLLHVESWRGPVRDHLLQPDRHLMSLLVIVPTLAGFLFQALSLARKKSPASAKSAAAPK